MGTFDHARVDRACRRYIDDALAAQGGARSRRRLDLWLAAQDREPDDSAEERSRATVRDLSAVATEAARHGARVMVTAKHPNRFRRRKQAAKARTQ